MAIKQYHFFGTIKKYTKGLLDTFNDIQVKRITDNGEKLITVPISFAQKDPSYLLNDTEAEALIKGNVNFLPRMSLSLETMEPLSAERGLNRVEYMTLPNGVNSKFLYTSFGVEIVYILIVETRSLTELTEILEQILPYFTPSLNLSINELDFLQEPTTIKVDYMSADIQLPTPENHDIRICSASVRLKLHGNLYPPVTDIEVIKYISLFMSINDEKRPVAALMGEPGKLENFKPLNDSDSLVLKNVVSEVTPENFIKLIPIYDDKNNSLYTVIYNLIYKSDNFCSIMKDDKNNCIVIMKENKSKCIVFVQLIDNLGKTSMFLEVMCKKDENGEYEVTVLRNDG